MRRYVKSLALFVCVFLGVIVVATPAFAAYVQQGRDAAWTRDYTRRVVVCDRESDGNKAYTQFSIRGGAKGWKYDKNGARWGCYITGRFHNKIYAHKVCERINWWPNRCSSYVYP